MEFEKIIKNGQSNDIGTAINCLIQDHLKRLNTCFIGIVDKVEGNKVDVIQAVQTKQNEKLVIPSLLVGIPQTENLNQSFKVQTGDVGLCLVCNDDISGYKQSGEKAKKMSDRKHDLVDSIFIPLSLANSNLETNKITSKENYEVAGEKEIIMVATNNIQFKGKLLQLESETTSLKKVLGDLSDILAGLKTIPAVQGSNLTLDPIDITKINQWKKALDTLLEK